MAQKLNVRWKHHWQKSQNRWFMSSFSNQTNGYIHMIKEHVTHVPAELPRALLLLWLQITIKSSQLRHKAPTLLYSHTHLKRALRRFKGKQPAEAVCACVSVHWRISFSVWGSEDLQHNAETSLAVIFGFSIFYAVSYYIKNGLLFFVFFFFFPAFLSHILSPGWLFPLVGGSSGTLLGKLWSPTHLSTHEWGWEKVVWELLFTFSHGLA